MIVFYLTIFFVLIQLIPELRKVLSIINFRSAVPNKAVHGFSVVIAAHNESGNLKELIPILIAQKYDHFEIILVLDRCTDNSIEVVNEYKHQIRYKEVTNLPDGWDGKKHALTLGIEMAENEWILLTDADCRPVSNQWVNSFNNEISDNSEVLTGLGPYTMETGILNAFIQYETFQTALQYASACIKGKPYMAVGRNLAYKKSFFINQGGFEGYEGVTGGDDDLFIQENARRKNTQIVFGLESLTYSQPKRKIREYITQKVRHLAVGRRYRTKLKITHLVKHSLHILVWASFIYLISDSSVNWMALGVFWLGMMIRGLFYSKSASKMGFSFNVLWYPVVDFLYAVIVPLIGIRAVIVKSTRWK